MNDTLYLQLKENILVQKNVVQLQDIAELSCADKKLLNRLRILPVVHLDSQKPGRYVFSVTELIAGIQETAPSLTVSPLGESSFIITYEPYRKRTTFSDILKTTLISLLSFFGSAFSIMTFNNDVNVKKIFSDLYFQATGQVSNGFTILEISYSIGIGVGVIFFFNHFGRMKFSSDPTPMQVQMRQYETQVNDSIIAENDRQKKKKESAT